MAACAQAFALLRVLDTTDMGGHEPFGFTDGVSQPSIDWHARRAPDEEAILPYGNLISAGEFVLGYPNEYGQYTDRPLLDADRPGQQASCRRRLTPRDAATLGATAPIW